VAARLNYIEPPCTEFAPHTACTWTSETRLAEIQALCSKVMELGDVSKNKPANNNNNNKEAGAGAELPDDHVPLMVNEETRWKSKTMKQRVSIIERPEEHEVPTLSTEEIVGKALLILNKMSLTTLERLTDKLILQTDITNNVAVRAAIIEMVVHKAQTEPHFGGMYAQLCAKIAKQFKPFKKELLTACQHEFETNTEDKIKEATKDSTTPAQIEYHSTLIRKAYIGHMRFLGELYMRDVVKLAIILHCLDELLKDETHNDSLECFASLMTTMGAKLDPHAKQYGKPFDWATVEAVRHHPNISARTKFLLQDLLDLKNSGMYSRLLLLLLDGVFFCRRDGGWYFIFVCCGL
jgi:translation initiation factor 4G